MPAARRRWALVAMMALPAACSGLDPGPVELVDPTEVVLPNRPQHHLACPPGRCAAEPTASSPSFARPIEEVERAWLDVVARSPRTEQLAHDPARHLYVFLQRTALLGFPDLISVRFLEVDTGVSLAVYSRSVYGYWDMGVNWRRVEDWLASLRSALAPGGAPGA